MILVGMWINGAPVSINAVAGHSGVGGTEPIQPYYAESGLIFG